MSIHCQIDSAKNWRVKLYWVFMAIIVSFLGTVLLFWAGIIKYSSGDPGSQPTSPNAIQTYIADVLNYVLPGMFQNFIDFLVLDLPWAGAGVLGGLALYYWIRAKFKSRSDDACELARRYTLKTMGRTY